MPWFVKHETFTPETLALSPAERRLHLDAHRRWVEAQQAAGWSIASGFLLDGDSAPGGGGLLVIEAPSYAEADRLIRHDPMILSGLVTWTLHEWKPVAGAPLL